MLREMSRPGVVEAGGLEVWRWAGGVLVVLGPTPGKRSLKIQHSPSNQIDSN